MAKKVPRPHRLSLRRVFELKKEGEDTREGACGTENGVYGCPKTVKEEERRL